MNRPIPITIVILTFFVFAAVDSATADSAGVSERPNVLIIMCDDLGYADVGFNGAKDIATPALDELATNGTICSSAYVAHPVCGPSRAAIMTGRYPHNFGEQFNLPILSLDFYPTLANLAGVSIPKEKILDGKDVWDDLLAGTNPHPDEMIYAMSHRSGFTDVSGRRNQWKVSRTHKRWQLYNVVQDIGETNDLSERYPERLKQMVSDVEKWGQNHQMPQWFYFDSAHEPWKENQRPFFDGTFSLP